MRALRLAALFVWMLLGAAASTIPNRLTVVVFDYASVPRSVMVSAVQQARRAFRAAGVETEWILCNPVEGCYVPERFVQVKILSRPLRTAPVSAYSLGSTVTCTATEHCAASYVFYNRVLTFSEDASSPHDTSLAYVMVHEIGHLLGLGHRPGGIMTMAFTARAICTRRLPVGSTSRMTTPGLSARRSQSPRAPVSRRVTSSCQGGAASIPSNLPGRHATRLQLPDDDDGVSARRSQKPPGAK